MILKFKLLNIILPILLILIASLLVFSWFKSGDFLATGEDGLILYNPDRTLNLYQSSWAEVGIGMPGSIFRPLIPLTYVEKTVLDLGLSLVQFQQIMFFCLLSTGMVSAYYLTKELLKPELKERPLLLTSFIAGLFYTFNPVSLLGVWYRFIYSFIFLYALMPLFLFLFIKGITEHKLRYTIISSLITLPFCYAFGSPAMIGLIWIFPVIYILVLVIQNQKKDKLFPISYLFISLFLWFLVSLWWIIPVKDYLTGFTSSTTANGFEFNISNLKANSQYYTIDNVIRLIHGGFLYTNQAFGSIYLQLPFLFLSWILPVFTLIGVIKLKNNFLKIFILVSLLVSIFLAKGSAWPFGEIQILLFRFFPPMQLYRNSLEKWGLILPTIFMIAFSFGFVKLTLSTKSKIFQLVLVSLLAGYLLIFHWPFITGDIIHFGDRDIAVNVPKSFEEANNIIGSNHRLLSVPMTGGASGIYSWDKPYAGHEASEYLFDSPTIAKAFGGDTYSDLFVKLSHDDHLSIISKAQIFAADRIVLRKDLNLKRLGMEADSLKKSEQSITASQLKLIADYPEFSIWQIPTTKMVPMVSTFDQLIIVDSTSSLIDLIKNQKIDLQTTAYICNGIDCFPRIAFNQQDFENLKKPDKVIFTKISPTDYKVTVLGNKGKFILTLFQSYYPNWSIKINGKLLNNDQHFVANGFANGFLINEKDKNFDIDLSFTPEEEYNQLSKFSETFTIFLLIFVVVLYARELVFSPRSSIH